MGYWFGVWNQVESKFYKKRPYVWLLIAHIAHTTPLFIEEGLLKVQDIFKLKLLEFQYKLSNNLLPPYFDSYRDIINREPPRVLRQHFIHQPMIKRSHAECTPLFQPFIYQCSLNGTWFSKVPITHNTKVFPYY